MPHLTAKSVFEVRTVYRCQRCGSSSNAGV